MSSSKYPERWIIPGGGVEPDEQTGAQTAVREVLEEAGVIGRLGRCLGIFEVIFPYSAQSNLSLMQKHMTYNCRF